MAILLEDKRRLKDGKIELTSLIAVASGDRAALSRKRYNIIKSLAPIEMWSPDNEDNTFYCELEDLDSIVKHSLTIISKYDIFYVVETVEMRDMNGNLMSSVRDTLFCGTYGGACKFRYAKMMSIYPYEYWITAGVNSISICKKETDFDEYISLIIGDDDIFRR